MYPACSSAALQAQGHLLYWAGNVNAGLRALTPASPVGFTAGMRLIQVSAGAAQESSPPNCSDYLCAPLAGRKPVMICDILNGRTAKGQELGSVQEIFAQCCHRYPLCSHCRVTAARSHFPFWENQCFVTRKFGISPLQDIGNSSPVMGCCYQMALTLFSATTLPAPTAHSILFWLHSCSDLREQCFRSAQ